MYKHSIALLGRGAAILAFFALVLGSIAFVTPANAATGSEEPASCEGMDVTTGNGECGDIDEAESHSKSSSKSKAVAVNGVKLTSNVTVLANIRANGTPRSQQTDCYRIPKAMSLWTSYNAEGTTGWHWKYYPKGYRFCRINDAVRDPNCHNMVKIGVPKSRPPKNAIYGKVKFVKKLIWEATAVAKADEKTTAVAKAWCSTSNTYAYGEGRGSAYAYAVARAHMKGSVLVKLLAQVQTAAQSNLEAQLGGKSVTQVRGEVRATAFTKASSEAHAKAVCNEQPPVDVCTNIPGSQPPGTMCYAAPQATAPLVNDVLVNNTRTITFTGKLAKGTTGFGTATAGTGTILDSNRVALTVDNDGYFSVTFTYKAGSEPGTDTVTLVVDQSDGQSVSVKTRGRDASGQEVEYFQIRAVPPQSE